MNLWKQTSYLGLILVLAFFVASASAQNEKDQKDSKAAEGEKKDAGKGDAAKGHDVFDANC